MKKGFSLIEMLVVIAIITILSSVILASLNSAREKSGAEYKVHFDGWTYHVESYRQESGGRCVYLPEKELRFCGEWSAEKINKDN